MTYDQLSIKIVRSINYHGDQRWNYKINLYPYNTVYFVIDGDGYVKVREQTIPLKAGYVYLIPANTLFSCWCDTFIHKLFVDVHVEIAPGYDIFNAIGSVRFSEYTVEKITRLIQANDTANPKNLLYFKGELTRVLSEFIDENCGLLDPGIMKFSKILKDIEQNLSSCLKVNEIAFKHGWNPTVLSRNFKKVFHCPLKTYVERLLLSKIKQDLIITDKNIKEIASEYKFCDPYYFSAFFKKHVGVSPARYRLEQGYKT